jgi:hypothetical protein
VNSTCSLGEEFRENDNLGFYKEDLHRKRMYP